MLIATIAAIIIFSTMLGAQKYAGKAIRVKQTMAVNTCGLVITIHLLIYLSISPVFFGYFHIGANLASP